MVIREYDVYGKYIKSYDSILELSKVLDKAYVYVYYHLVIHNMTGSVIRASYNDRVYVSESAYSKDKITTTIITKDIYLRDFTTGELLGVYKDKDRLVEELGMSKVTINNRIQSNKAVMINKKYIIGYHSYNDEYVFLSKYITILKRSKRCHLVLNNKIITTYSAYTPLMAELGYTTNKAFRYAITHYNNTTQPPNEKGYIIERDILKPCNQGLWNKYIIEAHKRNMI